MQNYVLHWKPCYFKLLVSFAADLVIAGHFSAEQNKKKKKKLIDFSS